MVKIEDDKYMDGYLKSNLDLLNEAVDKNWDGLLYICGYEGDGKTTLASQIVYYLDKNITLDQVVFTGEQFKNACLNSKPKQAILFDESYLAFSNRSLWTKESAMLVNMLTMIRKKQLFIIIVAPTFFDIQKYIAIHRSRAMINVYSEGLQRGYFSFYNRDKKLELYIRGKRDYNMKVTKPNFFGRFAKWFPFDEVAYDNKKESAIQELKDRSSSKLLDRSKVEIERARATIEAGVLKLLSKNKMLRVGALKFYAEHNNVEGSTLSKRIARVELK